MQQTLQHRPGPNTLQEHIYERRAMACTPIHKYSPILTQLYAIFPFSAALRSKFMEPSIFLDHSVVINKKKNNLILL